MAADILVLGMSIWLGEKSSVATQIVERLYGNSHLLNDDGQYAYYGRVGGCLVTGNEDGVKHCAMNVLYSLQHLGYTIPPQADSGWIGEAGPGPVLPRRGLGRPRERLHQPQHHLRRLEHAAPGADPQGRRRHPRPRQPAHRLGRRLPLRLPQPRAPGLSDVGRRRRKPRQQDVNTKLSRRASWATILGVPIGVVAVLLAYLALVDDDSGSVQISRSPRLERVDLIVRNSSPPHRAALEPIVHNGGRGRAVISKARIEILAVHPLPLCFTQGGFPLSEVYGARLPATADPGDVVETPLHQEIGPDQPDRFRIELGVISDETVDFRGLYLFEVRVSLVHDGERQALSLGEALVSLPGVPGTEYFLTAAEAKILDEAFNPKGIPVRRYWAAQMGCWRSNTRITRRALASPIARSPQMDAVDSGIVTPTFSALEH